jgi:hypothetical protein
MGIGIAFSGFACIAAAPASSRSKARDAVSITWQVLPQNLQQFAASRITVWERGTNHGILFPAASVASMDGAPAKA